MRKFLLIGISVALVTLFSLVPLTQPTNSTDSQPIEVANAQSDGIERCVISIEEGSRRADKVVEITPENSSFNCFDNLKDYVAFLTNGRVQLPANATQEEADAQLNQNASLMGFYFLARFYEHPNFVGNYIDVTDYLDCGSYWIPSIAAYGSNWDNRISSIRTYSGCNHVLMFEFPYYAGLNKICTGDCASLGIFDDDVKSVKIYQ